MTWHTGILYVLGILVCLLAGQAGLAVMGAYILWLAKECYDLDIEAERFMRLP